MKVTQGKKIKMEYELAIDGGEVLESSENRGPLEYIHGTGRMLAGLEQQIEGLTVGDEQSGVISAALAYGSGKDEDLPTKMVRRSDFPADETVEKGKQFEAKDPNGNPIAFRVVAIEGEDVTVGFIHPLAGKDIRYKVKILEISDPD